MTRSPMANPSTPAPSSTIWPRNSCPGTTGSRIHFGWPLPPQYLGAPCQALTSLVQTPQASTSITTSLAAAVGIGMVSSFNWPGPYSTTAVIEVSDISGERINGWGGQGAHNYKVLGAVKLERYRE